jgi:hypothetical protein
MESEFMPAEHPAVEEIDFLVALIFEVVRVIRDIERLVLGKINAEDIRFLLTKLEVNTDIGKFTIALVILVEFPHDQLGIVIQGLGEDPNIIFIMKDEVGIPHSQRPDLRGIASGERDHKNQNG